MGKRSPEDSILLGFEFILTVTIGLHVQSNLGKILITATNCLVDYILSYTWPNLAPRHTNFAHSKAH